MYVYNSGVGDDTTKKLLAVPKTNDGTGAAEAKGDKSAVTKWNTKKEVCGMVVDTTSSNI